MKDQTKKIGDPRQQSDGFAYSTDGKKHHVQAKGDAAKGLAVAASVIAGFLIGVLFG